MTTELCDADAVPHPVQDAMHYVQRVSGVLPQTPTPRVRERILDRNASGGLRKGAPKRLRQLGRTREAEEVARVALAQSSPSNDRKTARLHFGRVAATSRVGALS